jgi:hypothetical protein
MILPKLACHAFRNVERRVYDGKIGQERPANQATGLF